MMFMKILLKFIAVDLNLISFTPQHLTATFQQVQGLIPRYLRYVQIFPMQDSFGQNPPNSPYNF